MGYWLVLKDNYVIDRVVWDGITSWTYPFGYSELIEDVSDERGITDIYDPITGTFDKFGKPGAGPVPPELAPHLE